MSYYTSNSARPPGPTICDNSKTNEVGQYGSGGGEGGECDVDQDAGGWSICVDCDDNNPALTNDCSGGGGGGEDPCQACLNNGGALCIGGICWTPILIDTLGNGFELTDQIGGVNFDGDGNGFLSRTSWTAANTDDAWLALDRNGNGRIDNGIELFGDAAPQPPSIVPNGFLALAEFDKLDNGGNSDSKIDNRDTIFASLLLWQDTNHNGISELGELHSLPSLGLSSIDLDYRESRRRDQYGNWFGYRAKVRDERGAHLGRWAWDVWLVSSR